MLPRINQQAQGNNVQAPRVPTAEQYTQVGANQLPARPVQNMAPDNGQHGGAQRYMTPASGAMNMANQKQPNPYGPKANTYPGQKAPLPPTQGQLSPMPMQTPSETTQANNQYRQALQNRLINIYQQPMGYGMPQQQQQQLQQMPMPMMFRPGGV